LVARILYPEKNKMHSLRCSTTIRRVHQCVNNQILKAVKIGSSKAEQTFYLFPRYVMLPTGETTTAVPVQNTSSATSNSSTDTGRSSTFKEANSVS
jgi:hypothetical protein